MRTSPVPDHLILYIDEAVASGLMVELTPGLYALTDQGFAVAGKSRPADTIHPTIEISDHDLTIQHRSILMRLWLRRNENEPGLPGSAVNHASATTLARLGLVEEFTPDNSFVNWWRITNKGIVTFAHLCRAIAGQLDGSTRRLLDESDRIMRETRQAAAEAR